MENPDAGKSTEQLFTERKQRVNDAYQLKQPDRIPVQLNLSYMLADLGGVTKQELHDNPEKAQEILEEAALYFQPDLVMGVFGGPDVYRAVGDKTWKYPGYGLGPNATFQYVEGEYMKADEYDDFLEDPSDWALRVYLPRTCSNLEGLAMLPRLGLTSFGLGLRPVGVLAAPPVVEAAKALYEAALASNAAMNNAMESTKRLADLGFPPIETMGSFAPAPYDAMSDTLRGMRGIMLDMHRNAEKLLEAEEKVKSLIIKDVVDTCKMTGMKYAGSMLHRGSDGFMSLPQFEKFYWPQLKDMWLQLIDNGITPFVFYEGAWDERLEYLAELPKGKTIGWFQSSDIFKVKEVLGDTMCILGGMPNSLLSGGSPEEVREHTHKVCEEVGKGGGFIMCTGVGEMEGSKKELVKVWVDAVKEFGTYS